MHATFLQTSDQYNYIDMLTQTSQTIRAFCKENDFGYEAFIGVKRGFWPWQASFNRIYQLQEMIDRGYDGWAIYVDADAYICDHDFDLRGYLYGLSGKAFAATPSGASENFWDINNGVFFINLSHPTGRYIVRRWRQMFEAADERELRRCSDFYMGIDDQAMLHEILQSLPNLQKDCARCPWEVINSPEATFIRQQLRAMSSNLEARVAVITAAVRDVMTGLQKK